MYAFYHTDVPDWGTSLVHCLALGERAKVVLDTDVAYACDVQPSAVVRFAKLPKEFFSKKPDNEYICGRLTYHRLCLVTGGESYDKRFKAVQMGGPSGGCLPESLLDLPIDYESIVQAGAMMGSGGMVVMDEETCMVDMARFFLDFTHKAC